ncbi:MAG: glycosyltransferase [bacterium]|nr:glycosyltransferase [bacterium]
MEKNIKIVYVTHARLPTEKAHGRATVKLCEAFVRAGAELELVVPRLWARAPQDIFAHYNIKKKFTITYVSAVDFSFQPFFEYATYPLRFISFSVFAALYCWKKYRKEKNIIYFSHDAVPLYFLSFISKNIFYDIHDFPSESVYAGTVMKKARGFSVQTKAKIPFLKKHFGVQEDKIVYWPNGTDVAQFMIPMSKEEARERVMISGRKKIAVYAGQLFSWKGADTFIRASRLLPDIDFYIIGGTKKDVLRTKREVKESANANVRFIEFEQHENMPFWFRAADVLVLPNTGREDISRYWTSPMKLFEYMASGTPIVASRLPSIEEIIDEKMAFFAKADNPESFADAIQKAIDGGQDKGRRAQEEVQKYTWDARAKKIITHMRARILQQ